MSRFTSGCTMCLALALAAGWGCSDDRAGDADAVANVSPTQGNQARGTVEFARNDGGVRVVASLTGLPEGDHGFHIHETGDCSAADGTSAGGHFNPENRNHGAPDAAERHVGDLGNIAADGQGRASYDRVDATLAFDGAKGILGRAVVVHALPDDFSQPSGAAGARIGCGVIASK